MTRSRANNVREPWAGQALAPGEAVRRLWRQALPICVCAGLALVIGGGCESRAARAHKAPHSLLHDSPRLLHGLEALKGLLPKPIRALSLTVKTNRILLQVQNRSRKTRVDQYRFKNGSILGPIEVELRGDGKLKDNLFPLSYADLKALPRLVEEAEKRSGLAAPRAIEVALQRNLPISMDIYFSVTVTGQEGVRVVVARKDGSILSVRPGLSPESTASVTLRDD